MSSGVASEALTGAKTDADLRAQFVRPNRIIFPDDAPYSPQVATLGKMLFFDPRLSGAQTMSCATCHNPSFGWETPNARAVGSLNIRLRRHAPTIENLAESTYYGWDGAHASLEEQARDPITNPLEMNAKMPDVVARLEDVAEYRRWFGLLFPERGLAEETILQAIATFERTRQSGRARFDDWVDGEDGALSADARDGLALFVGRANCVACHTDWALTDGGFHDIGLQTSDPGRGAIDQADPAMRHAFKTPTLRNIAIRAPYMHDGSFKSLKAVLEHYRSGGIDRPSRSSKIEKIDIQADDIPKLIAFLHTLTADDLQSNAPILPVKK